MPLEPGSRDLVRALLELGRVPARLVTEALGEELRGALAPLGYGLARARELDCHSRRGRPYVYLVQEAGYPVEFAAAPAEGAPGPGGAGARAPREAPEHRKLQGYGLEGLTGPRARAAYEAVTGLLRAAPHAVERVEQADLEELWPLFRAGYLLYSPGEDLDAGDLLPEAAGLKLHIPHALLGRRALLEMAELLSDAARCALCQGAVGFGPRCPGDGCGRVYHAACLYSTGLAASALGAPGETDPRDAALERPVRCTECGHVFTDEEVQFLRAC